jgi:ubiquinone biosynthesis protein
MLTSVPRGPWFSLIRNGTAVGRFLQFGAWIAARRAVRSPPPPAEIGKRLRDVLERMGVTYVKLGQFLAIRFDLLHPDVARELSSLFDAVAPGQAKEIREVLETEFGRRTEEMFVEFDWNCIAAASIAQVHRARIASGDVVAVKVQRPFLRRMFVADIRFFRSLAWFVDRLMPLGAISLTEGLAEFENFTVREMDFLQEARTCERVSRLAGPHESAPRVYWEFTRERVLTMEFVRGVPLSTLIGWADQERWDEIERALPNVEIPEIIRRLAEASFRQIFEHGFFHADPHPGNIFVRPDGTVVFVDFGIFGQLTAWELDTLSNFVAAAAIGNTAGSLHYFSKLLISRETTDFARMKRDLSSVIYRWQSAVRDVRTPPEERHFGRYVNEFLSEARRHGTGVTLDTLLFWRALITLNGTALRLDPRTDVLALLGVFFSRRRWAIFSRRLSRTGTALAATDVLRLPAARTALPALRSEVQRNKESRVGQDRETKWTSAVLLVSTLLTFAFALKQARP